MCSAAFRMDISQPSILQALSPNRPCFGFDYQCYDQRQRPLSARKPKSSTPSASHRIPAISVPGSVAASPPKKRRSRSRPEYQDDRVGNWRVGDGSTIYERGMAMKRRQESEVMKQQELLRKQQRAECPFTPEITRKARNKFRPTQSNSQQSRMAMDMPREFTKVEMLAEASRTQNAGVAALFSPNLSHTKSVSNNCSTNWSTNCKSNGDDGRGQKRRMSTFDDGFSELRLQLLYCECELSNDCGLASVPNGELSSKAELSSNGELSPPVSLWLESEEYLELLVPSCWTEQGTEQANLQLLANLGESVEDNGQPPPASNSPTPVSETSESGRDGKTGTVLTQPLSQRESDSRVTRNPDVGTELGSEGQITAQHLARTQNAFMVVSAFSVASVFGGFLAWAVMYGL